MLTFGWFDVVTRGSNWKFRFDWRARLRMASVSGTSSITINGTVSSFFSPPAASAGFVSAGFAVSPSRAATTVAPSVFTAGADSGVGGVGFSTGGAAGGGVAGTGSVGAGGAGWVSAGLTLSAGGAAGGLLSWPKLVRPLVARPMSSTVSFLFICVVVCYWEFGWVD